VVVAARGAADGLLDGLLERGGGDLAVGVLHKELRAQTGQLAKLVAGAQGIVVVVIAAVGVVLRFA